MSPTRFHLQANKFDQKFLQCVKKLASQKGVVVGEKYCQLELGKKPPAGIGLLLGVLYKGMSY